MDPLALVLTPASTANVETPSFSGPVVIVTLVVPVSRAGDVNRNDTYRRELAALIETSILASENG